MNDWLPIDSAPLDGTRVMLAVFPVHPYYAGRESDLYLLANFNGEYWTPFVPNKWTHWMPLPAPLATGAAQ